MVSSKHSYAAGSAARRADGGGRRTLTAGRGPFGGLGRAVVRHPWLTILAWVVLAVAVIATAPGLSATTNESSFLPKGYESIQAASLQDKAFPQAGHVTAAAAIIVFSRADGGKLTSADSAKIRSVAASLGARHRPWRRGCHPAPLTRPSCSCTSPRAAPCQRRTWPRSARS